jgi:hypothetical protein
MEHRSPLPRSGRGADPRRGQAQHRYATSARGRCQLLDYAANAAAFWGLDKIRPAFEARHEDADAAATALEAFLAGDEEPERFWSSVDVNLTAGRLRLIFVADKTPSELRRIVEFLNEQMNQIEVLALEVRQYVEQGGDRLTLVPQLIGATHQGHPRTSHATPLD